jgi:hypothetical protein
METLLWLDDNRNPEFHVTFNGNIIWVKSYDEFNSWIEANGLPTKVSFDYDLGVYDYDGISCVKAIIRHCTEMETIPFPRFAIHSTHPHVEKLRTYITSNIKRYRLGDAVEEDRKPDTEDQKNWKGELKDVVTKTLEKVPDKFKRTIVITPTQTRNEMCKCGSLKKYKRCCGNK